MASVFLSYDHDDAARASSIAAALEANGHSVWWDQHLHGGAEYNSEIESAVERSDAVVVLWSERSVRSPWVRDEAGEGRDSGKLVPVLIEPVKPPMGFRQFQTLDLSSWAGGKKVPRLPELLNAIDRVSGRTTAPERASAPAAPKPKPPRVVASRAAPVSRRALLAGAATVIAAGAGGAYWWSGRSREDPRVQAAIDKARDAIGHQAADSNTVRMMEQAVTLAPNSAPALGMLALLKSLPADDTGAPDPAVVQQAEALARKSLSIDSKEPNALLAIFELQGSSLDWITRDRKLREIIGLDPKNVTAIAELVLLTQATGLTRESMDWNEKALAIEPLSPDYLTKRALKLFIMGRTPECDKVLDQVRALYPSNPWPWWVRFYTYAFTGRAPAAAAMLKGNPDMGGRPPLANLWQQSLPAIEQPSPATIARAREVAVAGARKSAMLASQSVQIMSYLGEVDTAFDIANGYLLSVGPLVQENQSEAAQSAAWRVSTQWMWTPPAAPMRRDPRFLKLCAGIGLADYWKSRGVKPDYQTA